LKIYINKQVDLPNGGIFGKDFSDKDLVKFIKGFKTFLSKRFDIEIQKRTSEKGRRGQKEKLQNLLVQNQKLQKFHQNKLFHGMMLLKSVPRMEILLIMAITFHLLLTCFLMI
jgi:hypothetical protein